MRSPGPTTAASPTWSRAPPAWNGPTTTSRECPRPPTAPTTSLSPANDDWQTTDTTDIDALIYAPCGAMRNFNINTELRVDAGTSDPTKTNSFVTMDSTDGSFNTLYHFAWKECPKP
ncbi:hypothetical protein GCM10020000_02260 [Streptomyces olivoverticillatus]